MPREVIAALARVKKACARANAECEVLDPSAARSIAEVCDEILTGRHDDEFPLSVWQTGSGTHTNMNLNEVIANRAHVLAGGSLDDGARALHPNDHVNRSQSSNDVIPTAMNLAALQVLAARTLPGLRLLRDELTRKSQELMGVVKLGRTHMMDATPLRLGDELSGHAHQLGMAILGVERASERLQELALGGTAVGTGLNAPADFAERAVAALARETGLALRVTRNHFAAQGSHDDLVEVSSALRNVAVSLMKVGEDVRLLASGPRAGLGELELPATEPGSSIMPGKVNPTQVEALTMVCCQVIGNDVAIATAGMRGQLQLNAFKPVIIFNLLVSARIVGDAAGSFAERCIRGMQAKREAIAAHLERSLMLVTALTPVVGYSHAAEIAKKAHREGTTLKQAALSLGRIREDQFDECIAAALALP